MDTFRLFLEVIVRFLRLIFWGKELNDAQEVRRDDLETVKKTINEHRGARDTADGSRVRDDDPDLFKS